MKTPKSDKVVFKTYQQRQPIFLPPSLDELIPPGHVVRVVNETIERMNIDPILAGYKGGGTSAYHPRMLLKVLVYAYMERIYSSRRIAKAIREQYTFMWLAGGNKPDFRTINRFRSSHLKGTIEEVFASIVQLCLDKGLINEEEVFSDGTKLEANANKYTYVWKKSNDRYKEQRKAKIKAQLADIDRLVEEENRRYGDRDLEELGEDAEVTSEELEAKVEELNRIVGELNEDDSEEKRQEKKRARKVLKQVKEKDLPKLKQYEEQEKRLGDRNSYSRTDVDATFMRMKEDAMQGGELKPGYNVQLSSSSQVVVAVSAHDSAADSPLLMEHLDKVEEMLGKRPRVVVTDAGYGSEENYALLEERGIEAYVKYNTFEQERKPGFKNKVYEVANWPYNAEQDAFTCPEGRLLRYRGDESRTSRNGYVSHLKIYKVRSCAGCPVRKACMPRGGKTKRIQISEELVRLRRQAFERLESEEGKRLRAKRSCDVESVYGHIKGNRGFRRFLLRGLDNVTIEVYLLCMAHNVLKLAAAGVFGPILTVWRLYKSLWAHISPPPPILWPIMVAAAKTGIDRNVRPKGWR